ncbi:Protein MRPL-47 b [Aphelenchoides avenae]|nr:Protein MRPL-47 b [Aphelenchus avenae]
MMLRSLSALARLARPTQRCFSTTPQRSSFTLAEFFDDEANWQSIELRPLKRPGRSWSQEELRLKSNTDLHKLWYVLLKERNMLLTMREAYTIRNKVFPNPERIDRVQEVCGNLPVPHGNLLLQSMENLESVVHERNDAYLRLETGEGAAPPERTVTSMLGFTHKEQAKEHYEPFEVTGEKQYEVPYLDDEAYRMQKLWLEKQQWKHEMLEWDKYWKLHWAKKEHNLYGRSMRVSFNRTDHMPQAVVAAEAQAETSK